MRVRALIGFVIALTTPGLSQPSHRDLAVQVHDYRRDPLTRVGFEIGTTPTTRFTVSGVDTATVARVTGLRRLPDGRIFVATLSKAPAKPLRFVPSSPLDSGVAEISLYDARGGVLARADARVSVHDIAGRGSDAPVFLGALPGDSVLLACSLNGIARISTNTSMMGTVITQDSIGPGLRYVFGLFADGSLLEGGPVSTHAAPVGRPSVDSMQVVVYSPDLAEATPWSARVGHLVPRFPATTGLREAAHFADFLGAQTALRASSTALPITIPAMARPVLANPTLGTIGDRVWSLDESRWELSIRDRNGALLSLARLPAPAGNARLSDTRLAPHDSSYLIQLLVDDEQQLWIQASDTPAPWRARAPTIHWWVFDSDGVFLGGASLPSAFRPYQAGHGYVTGLLFGRAEQTQPVVASFTIHPVR